VSLVGNDDLDDDFDDDGDDDAAIPEKDDPLDIFFGLNEAEAAAEMCQKHEASSIHFSYARHYGSK